jgi:hypothetical protein
MRSFKIDNDVYEIPDNEASAFIKDAPNAVELQSFKVGEDTFDVDLKDVQGFLKDIPHAVPLNNSIQPQQFKSAPWESNIEGIKSNPQQQIESNLTPEKYTNPLIQDEDQYHNLLIKPNRTPEEDTYLNDYVLKNTDYYKKNKDKIESPGKGFGQALKSGVATTEASLAGIPHLINSSIAAATNVFLPKDKKIDSRTVEFMKTLSGFPMDETLLKGFADEKQLEAQKANIKKTLYNPDADLGVLGAIKKGDYSAAIENTFSGIIESAPQSMSVMAAGALTGGIGSFALASGMTASGKLQELDQNTDFSDDKKVLIATAYGLPEGLFESVFGAGAAGQAMESIVKKFGKEQAEEQIKKSLLNGWKKVIEKHPYLQSLGEGMEEFNTQIAQNAVDKYSGVDPSRKLTDGAFDAFAIGMVQGAGIALPMDVAKTISLRKMNRDKKVAVDNEFNSMFAHRVNNDGDIVQGQDLDGNNYFIIDDTNSGAIIVENGETGERSMKSENEIKNIQALPLDQFKQTYLTSRIAGINAEQNINAQENQQIEASKPENIKIEEGDKILIGDAEWTITDTHPVDGRFLLYNLDGDEPGMLKSKDELLAIISEQQNILAQQQEAEGQPVTIEPIQAPPVQKQTITYPVGKTKTGIKNLTFTKTDEGLSSDQVFKYFEKSEAEQYAKSLTEALSAKNKKFEVVDISDPNNEDALPEYQIISRKNDGLRNKQGQSTEPGSAPDAGNQPSESEIPDTETKEVDPEQAKQVVDKLNNSELEFIQELINDENTPTEQKQYLQDDIELLKTNPSKYWNGFALDVEGVTPERKDEIQSMIDYYNKQNAKTIRSDQGQPDRTGDVGAGREETRGQDLQQQTSAQPGNKEQQIKEQFAKIETGELSLNDFLDNSFTPQEKPAIFETVDNLIEKPTDNEVNELLKTLEKKCFDAKAADGIRGNITKGGNWIIIEDYKGEPSHKSGGVETEANDVNIEAEGNEIKIQNDNGDEAIIPKKHRIEVEGMIKDGCHKCIDDFVIQLPMLSDMAAEGGLYPAKDTQDAAEQVNESRSSKYNKVTVFPNYEREGKKFYPLAPTVDVINRPDIFEVGRDRFNRPIYGTETNPNTNAGLKYAYDSVAKAEWYHNKNTGQDELVHDVDLLKQYVK